VDRTKREFEISCWTDGPIQGGEYSWQSHWYVLRGDVHHILNMSYAKIRRRKVSANGRIIAGSDHDFYQATVM